MEQYLTFPVNAKVQDRFSEGLLMTLIEEGPKALANPEDIEVRANIMWTATLAQNQLIGSGVPQDWTTHMIGHEITGYFGVDHGRTLTIVLPAVMKVRLKQKEQKLLQYAERIFGINEGSVDDRIDAVEWSSKNGHIFKIPFLNIDFQLFPLVFYNLDMNELC